MGFIRKFLIWAILIPAVLFGALVGVPMLAGCSVCTVREDSVRDLRPGSLLYVREVDPQSLDIGDVITYMASREEVKTHRIAGVVEEEGNPAEIRFRTRNDHSGAENATLVYYRNVLGIPVIGIPLLGYIFDWLQTPAGWITVGAVGIFWLLLVLLPLFVRGKKKSKKGGKYLR